MQQYVINILPLGECLFSFLPPYQNMKFIMMCVRMQREDLVSFILLGILSTLNFIFI